MQNNIKTNRHDSDAMFRVAGFIPQKTSWSHTSRHSV